MKPLLLALALLQPLAAAAQTHEVRMYSRNARGPMLFEPDFLQVAAGDQVRFIPAQPSHNAATIEGMLPKGALPFKSKINEAFTVTLTVPGTYGIKCSPHFAMGMVMLLQVGAANGTELPPTLPPTLPADLPARARARFETILAAP